MRNPERALVTHWFNPAQIVPTVEIVPGPRTAEAVIETALDLHRRAGKLAVRVNGELPGFLVNRVQMAFIREVWDLLEQGVATAEDIDAAIRGSIGFRLATSGPLEVCDYGGLDIWRTVYSNLAGQIRSDTDLPEVVEKLTDEGHLGPRTGRGFHTYEPGTQGERQAEREDRMSALAGLLKELGLDR